MDVGPVRTPARPEIADGGDAGIVLKGLPHANEERMLGCVGRAAAEDPGVVILKMLGKEDRVTTTKDPSRGNRPRIPGLIKGPRHWPPVRPVHTELPRRLCEGLLNGREAAVVGSLPRLVTIEQIDIAIVRVTAVAGDGQSMEPSLLRSVGRQADALGVPVPGPVQNGGQNNHRSINHLGTVWHGEMLRCLGDVRATHGCMNVL